MKTNLFLLLLTSFGLSAAPLTCNTAPGSHICELAKQTKTAAETKCGWGSCGKVWSDQVTILQRLMGVLEGAEAKKDGVALDVKREIDLARGAVSWTTWTYDKRDAFQTAWADAFVSARGEFEKMVDALPKQ